MSLSKYTTSSFSGEFGEGGTRHTAELARSTTDQDEIFKYSKHWNEGVADAALENPNMSHDTIDKILARKMAHVNRTLATHPNLSQDHIRHLHKNEAGVWGMNARLDKRDDLPKDIKDKVNYALNQ